MYDMFVRVQELTWESSLLAAAYDPANDRRLYVCMTTIVSVSAGARRADSPGEDPAQLSSARAPKLLSARPQIVISSCDDGRSYFLALNM